MSNQMWTSQTTSGTGGINVIYPPVKTEVVVVRAVEFEIGGDGDGRTLFTRIVPWDTPATVADPPDYIPYQEAWAQSAFDKQLKAAHRVNVLMNFEHERGIGGVVGRGTELRSERDGLHGVFRLLGTQDADKALELVREDILTGMSLEAKVSVSERVDGVVIRKVAHLSNVALCRNPAFKDAQVLAVRNDDGVIVEPEDPPAPEPEPEDEPAAKRERIELPAPLDVARLEAVGIDPVRRAFTDKPWDGSASKYEDTAAYCRACLIDDNPAGADKTQALCHLPIREPNGDVNVNAVRNALARVMQVQTSAQNKTRARTRLQTLLGQYQASAQNKTRAHEKVQQMLSQPEERLESNP